MFSFFEETNLEKSCCLCGSTENLSGEHKFKRSVLADTFGSDEMRLGQSDHPNAGLQHVQGTKSKKFHFDSKLCVSCNGDKTQDADNEFNRFHSLVKENGGSSYVKSVFSNPRYRIGTTEYLNLFRYFAKLLCCHIADSGGPRFKKISDFAISESNKNPIFLSVCDDPTYAELSNLDPDFSYVAHGGLAVSKGMAKPLAGEFSSTATFNSVQYGFSYKLPLAAQLALHIRHREFAKKCSHAISEAHTTC